MQIVHGNLSVGDNGSLTCISIIPADVMEWLDSAGKTIISEAAVSELNLIFTPVNTSINKNMYTCRANKSGSVSKTVTVSVSGKLYSVNKFILIPSHLVHSERSSNG